jgi:hypothetical protein
LPSMRRCMRVASMLRPGNRMPDARRFDAPQTSSMG